MYVSFFFLFSFLQSVIYSDEACDFCIVSEDCSGVFLAGVCVLGFLGADVFARRLVLNLAWDTYKAANSANCL